MKIAISVETASDLSKELIKENDIKVVPFTIFLGDKDYKDGEITCDEIIKFVDENKILPKTGAVNRITYEEHFAEILKDYDGIVHISLSSQLSSAYENALAVSKELKNVFVIDSRSLSTGIGLLALYASKLVKENTPIEQIYNKVQARVESVSASFILKRVDYLYKGGRCNALVYLGANLLKIRPQIILKDGKMVSGKKYRGNFEHGVNAYCKDVLEEFSTPDLSVAFVTYTTASPEVVETAKNHLINRGFKNVYITRAGGTITSHCGENCLGILFINDGAKTE